VELGPVLDYSFSVAVSRSASPWLVSAPSKWRAGRDVAIVCQLAGELGAVEFRVHPA
jgi:hypothetical protein